MLGLRLDLRDLWQARRWRFLLNIIDQLPGHSHFAEAIADDEELAAATLFEEVGDPPRPRLSSWTEIVAEQRVTNERLGIALQYLSEGRYTPSPLPRPEVARERVRQRSDRDRLDRLYRQGSGQQA